MLSLSVTTGSAGRGALLAFAYCLGLGIPFALMAMGLGWVSSALAFVRRHFRIATIVGASMLVSHGHGHGHRCPGAVDLPAAKPLRTLLAPI
ncbi:hypothetical protein BMF89_14990 [Arthrobacter sp. SRS-W-1-2016]|uniref:cytochrome c biogenesis protein CcdA n=1 Tax=Arthrobacter sp. SRS-W-1-2016 TaxID=1930254 RepID=UPI0009CCA158|nr:cytochrome c biogenesis protein CcdA [Arthrobacter sp. SRS-W-1-2016]OOP60940.1 hypothetical protein BMF89_14990 [Arthrobacter sp. SRS-W-1-2016]